MMRSAAQKHQISVTPQKPRFTCGFPYVGAIGQNGSKTFFKIGGYWDGKTPNVNKRSGVSVYNARGPGLVDGLRREIFPAQRPERLCREGPGAFAPPPHFCILFFLPN